MQLPLVDVPPGDVSAQVEDALDSDDELHFGKQAGQLPVIRLPVASTDVRAGDYPLGWHSDVELVFLASAATPALVAQSCATDSRLPGWQLSTRVVMEFSLLPVALFGFRCRSVKDVLRKYKAELVDLHKL